MLDPEQDQDFELDDNEVETRASRGSGPGGQHRNKTDSCITAIHKPTGISVRIDMRSQHQSKEMALKSLAAKIGGRKTKTYRENREKVRKNQVGSGMRGDKVRTYRRQDDQVKDHRTGKTWKLKKWLRGEW